MSSTNSLTNVRKQQRNFYLILAVAGCLFAILQFVKNRPEMGGGLMGAALFFLVIEFVIPPLGRVVFKAWMAFAHVLGWVNTRLLITLVYFFLITPIGLLRRAFAAESIYSAKACHRRKSAWFALTDDHHYSAPF